jgi:hypothetical protein
MKSNMKTPYILSVWLATLMAAQSLLGRVFQGQYRDVEWIRTTWFGNDLVTLLLVAPLLIAALALVRRDSLQGLLLWLGVLGYGAYNYAYYLLGASLNVFFPLYVVLLVLSVATLILVLARIDAVQVAAAFRTKTPVRIIGGYLVFVAFGLSLVWYGTWAAYIFAGRPTPVETEAFKLVAALDNAIMVPMLAIGGILLWRRNVWGGVLAGIAGIQGSLYLLVLSVNSGVAILRGLVEAPGELPVWGVLAISTAATTVVLLSNVQQERQDPPRSHPEIIQSGGEGDENSASGSA